MFLKLNTYFKLCVFLAIFLLPVFVNAQEIHQELQGVWKAKVTDIISQEEKYIEGTDTKEVTQVINAEILEGDRKGEVVTLNNDYIVLKDGQTFFLNYFINISGTEYYSVRDVDRIGGIFILLILFVIVVLIFGKFQGLRSLISLFFNFLVILYVLLPVLLKGYSPILVSIVVGSFILFFAIFFTHGFNRSSTIAFSGTVISVALTGLLAFFSIKLLNLSGFFSEETMYLNFNTSGSLNFEGLLLGGIIIGVLGVLDDIAITQVAVVSEIRSIGQHLSNKEIFDKAMNVGKEHVSALVNTIVLAYAGVSLPLLLWFSKSTAPINTIINNEIFATEIARTIVGSIGLIITVPITTILAVMVSKKISIAKKTNHHHHHH